MRMRLAYIAPYVVALQYFALSYFGAQRVSWRFFSLRDTRPFLMAFGLSGAALVVIRYTVPMLWREGQLGTYMLVPLSIILLDAGIGLTFTLAARGIRRSALEDAEKQIRRARSEPPTATIRTLLIGAGHGGVSTAQELSRRPDLGILAVGFVD